MKKILYELKNFLWDKVQQNSVLFLGLGIAVFFILFIISLVAFHGKNTGGIVLSKKTVDDLVDKAATQKYLQKVFNSPDDLKKLPMPKTSSEFQPPPDDMFGDKSSKEAVAQRCTYKGQSYVIGDIVKTDQEWVKCTPTIVFVESEDKDKGKITVKQAGSPVWTLVQ